jgi:plastocyanin
MSSIKRRVLLSAIFLAALFHASHASAGDVKGKVSVEGIRSAENIAVYVDAIAGKDFPAPAEHGVMNQKSLKFSPHLLVVLKGTTVEFLNSDPVGHNVYWPSVSGNKKLTHNMGTWPKDQQKPFQFNDLGVVPLLCNVHPEMSGYVIVVPTPYFAVTDKEGSFEIKNLPPGTYTLKTWSEEGKPTTQAVTVGVTTANVDLVVKK